MAYVRILYCWFVLPHLQINLARLCGSGGDACPTAQSSITSYNWGANLAVDGLDTTWCETANEANPWWRVELPFGAALTSIMVLPRSDQWKGRIDNFHAYIGNSQDYTGNTLCAANVRVFTAAAVQVPCSGVGRYLHIVLQKTDYLNVLEVQVFGSLHVSVIVLSEYTCLMNTWYISKSNTHTHLLTTPTV